MSFPERYHAVIAQIGAYIGMPDPMLHLHAGMAILLVARMATRRSLGSFVPFYFVMAAEFGNELMDYLAYSPLLADTLLDIANTLFWPFALSLGVRIRPMLGRARR